MYTIRNSLKARKETTLKFYKNLAISVILMMVKTRYCHRGMNRRSAQQKIGKFLRATGDYSILDKNSNEQVRNELNFSSNTQVSVECS